MPYTPCDFAADIPEIQPINSSPEETSDVDNILPVHPSPFRQLTMSHIPKLQNECNDYKPIMDYLCSYELPRNAKAARKITAQTHSYVMTDDALYMYPFYTARTRCVPRPAKLIKRLAIRGHHIIIPLQEEVILVLTEHTLPFDLHNLDQNILGNHIIHLIMHPMSESK